MKQVISTAVMLAMLISISSVIALPLSAEGVQDNTSGAAAAAEDASGIPEAITVPDVTTAPDEAAIPEESSEPSAETLDSAQEVTGSAPAVTDPGSYGEAAIPTENPDESRSGPSSDAGTPDDIISEDGESFEVVCSADPSVGEIDNDGLFEQYLTKLLYGDTKVMPLASSWGRAHLSGTALRIYDELKPHILAIADGRETSTTIYLSPGIVVTKEVMNEFFVAMKTDFPSEIYWMDIYTIGYRYGYDYGGPYYITFDIAEGYHTSKANSYGMHTEIDTSKILRAKNALSNARAICSKAAGSDYDKVRYFTEEICSLVEYDHDAANNSHATDIGPWMLINTFDGDTNTNIVCEGYAKSLQYLCELAGIESYCVSGYMNGGGHMWNLVRLNGKIHMLDVTACDSGYEFDKLLYGIKLRSDGYDVSNMSYTYNSDMYKIYPRSILFPSAPDGEIIKTGYCGAEGDGKNLTWKLSDLGTLTISGHGEMADFTVVWNGGDEWHSSYFIRGMIKNVVIEEGVESVGKNAFYYCEGIEKITLPSTLTSIGEYAFVYTKLETITIPKAVTAVGADIFGWDSETGIKEIHCETAIRPQGWSVNWNNTGAAVYWAGITMIDNGYCGGEGDGSNLTWEIDPSGTLIITGNGKMKDYSYDAPWWKLRNSVTKIVIGDGVTTIGNNAFIYCLNATDVAIPNTVTTIGESAFKGCNGIKSISIPEGVTQIKYGAFSSCSGITEMILPNGVTTIDYYAFSGMSSLVRAYFPASVQTVGLSLFNDCESLKDIYFESTTPPTGWDSFWNDTDANVHFGEEMPAYSLGDVNGDFKVNNQDAIYLLKHVMNKAQYPINQNGDMNGDGNVNNQDAIYLLKHVMNPSGYPLKNNQ